MSLLQMDRWIGQNVPRVDAGEKVTGRAKYTGDLYLPNMCFGKVLRSPLPHARITRIDTAAARALPGVVAVISGDDLGEMYYGHAIKDRPVLASEKVRFVGEPVAAVAAETEQAAEEALSLIDVQYEELDAATTIEEASRDDAPLLHDEHSRRPGLFHGLGDLGPPEGNTCYHYKIAKGASEDVFKSAAHVVGGEYTFPAVYQYAMEPHTALAQYTDETITVWATCQHPHLVRAEIADLFGRSLGDVRIVVPYLGGGFGSKSYTKMEPITVALSRAAQRPVLVANSVQEAMMTTRRHGMRCRMRTAMDADGRLLARECEAWLDTGAYADNGPRVVATAGDAAPGPYKWEAFTVNAWGVYTNAPPSGSYRAFGATHLQWIGEIQIDQLGAKVGLDPLEIRKRNLLKKGEEVREGGKPLDADLIGDITQVAERLDWSAPKAEGTGRTLSVGLLAAGAHPVSTASARMAADGTVIVLISTTEVGQGARTVMGQIAASELDIDPSRVRVLNSDTDYTPYDRSTGASRSTTLSGKAVQNAVIDLRNKLLSMASLVWDKPESSLVVRDGTVRCGDESLSYREIISRYFGLFGGEVMGFGEVRPEKGTGSFAEGPVFWEVCIGGAQVRIDSDTGKVHIEKLVTVSDVGRAINPGQVEGQEHGGSMQGIGNALYEEMIFDDGQLLNPTLLDYRIPGWEDLPERFESVLVENEDGPGPYGLKGVGEGALSGSVGAVAGAVQDAGANVTALPLTPERVWKGLHARNKGVD